MNIVSLLNSYIYIEIIQQNIEISFQKLYFILESWLWSYIIIKKIFKIINILIAKFLYKYCQNMWNKRLNVS